MENGKFHYQKKTPNSSIPDTFIKNNKKITDRKHIANGFNDFFVNVGPNLAKGIQTPSTNIKMQDYLGPSVVILVLNPRKSGQIFFMIYYGRYRSKLAILKSPKQNSLFKFVKLTNSQPARGT